MSRRVEKITFNPIMWDKLAEGVVISMAEQEGADAKEKKELVAEFREEMGSKVKGIIAENRAEFAQKFRERADKVWGA